MTQLLQEIKKSVSFVFLPISPDRLHPIGTGFFVGVKNEINENLLNIYFVTAKHVLLDVNGKYQPNIVLRLNTHDGQHRLINISLKDIKIYEHPDKDVDIALFDCLPDRSVYDFKCVQDSLIANKKVISDHDISEGDDVFFAGLFTSHIGQKKNQPIIRFGKVALISDEKIEWKESNKPTKFVDLLLLECQSYGGNSGSPVFYHLSPMRKTGSISIGGPSIFLAGVMTGSFLTGNEVFEADATRNLVALQNIGIAAVTPADKLYEILFLDEVKNVRISQGKAATG